MGYTVEFDLIDKNSWYDVISNFNDATIYQAWGYDKVRCGRKNISHMLLKKDGLIVAAAQLRILKLPLLNAGIAYVMQGPLWRPKGTGADLETFCQAVRALRNEYACRRGLVLRIYPKLFSDESEKFLPLLKEEGFRLFEDGKFNRTLLVDLKPSLEELRKGFNQKWRNCLNRAERNGLEVNEEYDGGSFEMFIELYEEMIKRKKFIPFIDINEFRLIQQDLPQDFKMRIMLCRLGGALCAGAIFSAIGDTGIYLFGATNDIGIKNNGSYLVQWKCIEHLKKNHLICYDLNGINPDKNPGTYHFKNGLGGKNGKDVYFLGKFQTCTNFLSSVSVRSGERLFSYYRKAREVVHNWR